MHCILHTVSFVITSNTVPEQRYYLQKEMHKSKMQRDGNGCLIIKKLSIKQAATVFCSTSQATY